MRSNVEFSYKEFFRNDGNSTTETSNCTNLTFFGQSFNLSPARISLAFTVFGTFWILSASMFLGSKTVGNIAQISIHVIFGAFFVILTTVLLYLLIRKYAASVSISSELLTRVFEISPVGIAVIRQSDNQMLLANRQFENFSGYSLEEYNTYGFSDR